MVKTQKLEDLAMIKFDTDLNAYYTYRRHTYAHFHWVVKYGPIVYPLYISREKTRPKAQWPKAQSPFLHSSLETARNNM